MLLLFVRKRDTCVEILEEKHLLLFWSSNILKLCSQLLNKLGIYGGSLACLCCTSFYAYADFVVWAHHLSKWALGIQIRSLFYEPPHHQWWRLLLFLCSVLGSFTGRADKAVWKHVMGLVGAALHRCEDHRSEETLEPAAATTERSHTPRPTRRPPDIREQN